MPYSPELPPVPATPVRPVEAILHGVRVADPYRWLEDNDAPEVQAWTDRQNARTRAYLDAAPGREAVEARMRDLMEVGDVGLPAIRRDRWFHARRRRGQNQAVHYWREGPDGTDNVLVDPDVLDPTGLTVVDWVSPSPDGRLAAYGTYRAGDENTTLRIIEVDSGRRLPLEIAGKTEAPDWLPDSSGFIYRNLRDAADPYSGQVRCHRLGSDPLNDGLLLRQLTVEEDSSLATTWGPFSHLTRDGRWLLLGYWTGTRSNDLWLVDVEAYFRTGQVRRQPVVVGADGRTTGTVTGDTLVLHTTVGSPRGRVVVAPVSSPDRNGWRDLVAERPDASVESVQTGRGLVAVTYLHQASHQTEIFDMSGRMAGRLTYPGPATATVAVEPDRTEACVQVTGFGLPATILRVDLLRPEAAPTVWASPDVPFDGADIVVDLVRYPSTDGTPISMFLARHRQAWRAGVAPAILYGYGGFNISLTPSFSASVVHWLESGGLYAIAHLRGGGEYGEAWHEAGMLGRKQQVFDDFIAAAEWLSAGGEASPDRLALAGGSNGGLLVGAAITQRPDLCRAAIVAVPLLDMLRYQDFLMGRYWVPEYGSAEDAEAFAYLHAYSPYHRVRAGTRYPAVLLTAGEHDARVHPMHARKMAAALQASTASDANDRPVLLWVDREAGHGQGKPLNLRLRDAVDQRVFEDLVLRSGR